MRLTIAIGCSALAFSSSSLTAQVHGFQGAGVSTCGTFASHYKSSPEFYENYYFTWAQGFMSGLNAHFGNVTSEVRDLNAKSTEDQARAIRDYCDKHPLQIYIEAVRANYFSLPVVNL